jgi:hypothetical protein
MASVRERVEALQRYRAGNAPGWLNKDPVGQVLHRDNVLALADQLDAIPPAEHAHAMLNLLSQQERADLLSRYCCDCGREEVWISRRCKTCWDKP